MAKTQLAHVEVVLAPDGWHCRVSFETFNEGPTVYAAIGIRMYKDTFMNFGQVGLHGCRCYCRRENVEEAKAMLIEHVKTASIQRILAARKIEEHLHDVPKWNVTEEMELPKSGELKL